MTRFIEFEDLLQGLSDDYQIPLILFYYADYSIKDISRILKVSENTIKTRMKRAKKQLEQSLSIDIGGLSYE